MCGCHVDKWTFKRLVSCFSFYGWKLNFQLSSQLWYPLHSFLIILKKMWWDWSILWTRLYCLSWFSYRLREIRKNLLGGAQRRFRVTLYFLLCGDFIEWMWHLRSHIPPNLQADVRGWLCLTAMWDCSRRRCCRQLWSSTLCIRRWFSSR